MNMTLAQQLNTAITRRNIARHREDTSIVAWWEAQAKYLAGRLRTRLVEMPGRPGALVPEFWMSVL